MSINVSCQILKESSHNFGKFLLEITRIYY